MKKVIFIQILFTILISCQSEEKKITFENEVSILSPEKQQPTVDTQTIFNKEITITDTIISIDSKGLRIQIKYSKADYSYSFKEIKNSEDTIILDFIEGIKSIKPDEGSLVDWEIEQRYQSELCISFDGKAFILENWKKHQSPWIRVWYDKNGNNVKTYSYFDAAYFPEFSNTELIKAIRLNEPMLSKHWVDYLIEEFSKQNRNNNSEPYYHSIITESHFRILVKEKAIKYIIIKHNIGC